MAKPKISIPKSKIYTSKSIRLDVANPNQVKRVAIEIDGIDKMTATYEGRIFLNNIKADNKTPLTVTRGYAGSFYVFGHGAQCYGGRGHCDYKPRDNPFDLRRSGGTGPGFRRVIITNKQILGKILRKSDNIITIVPIPLVYDPMSDDTENVFRFKKISVIAS